MIINENALLIHSPFSGEEKNIIYFTYHDHHDHILIINVSRDEYQISLGLCSDEL